MDEESYLNPLAKNYEKSDGLATNTKPLGSAAKQESGGSSKLVVYILLGVVVASIAFLIFGLVVLRIKTPTLRLSNVILKDLRYNSSSSSLNMTVIASLRLHNMNFGRFQFGTGSATLFYGNASIGKAEVHGGEVGGRKRREMSATVEVMRSDVNISEWDLVKLRSYAELRGEIQVMKMVNRRRTAFMNCSVDLNLTTQAIQGYSCR